MEFTLNPAEENASDSDSSYDTHQLIGSTTEKLFDK